MSIGNLGGYNIPGITGPAIANPYSSGQAYAQEIAGGLPMEQVIAPGVSYSPDVPGGYTQADLTGPVEPAPTTPIPVPPPTPPVVPPTPPTITPPIAPPDIGIPFIPPGFLPYQGPEINLADIQELSLQELLDSMIDTEVQSDLLGDRVPKRSFRDLSELESRIGALESMPQPESINIEEIRQGLLSDIPTFTPRTDEEILGLMSQVPQPQMPDISQFATQADIQQAIAGIPAAPAFDPTGLQAQIAGLESQIGGIPQFDPTGLQSQIAGLQAQIGQIPTFDPTNILARLSALETKPIYNPTVGPQTLIR
tara:strand:+ start:52 stop:981 length:930 start_codon:yes stop_codon:yes gene_type:complete